MYFLKLVLIGVHKIKSVTQQVQKNTVYWDKPQPEHFGVIPFSKLQNKITGVYFSHSISKEVTKRVDLIWLWCSGCGGSSVLQLQSCSGWWLLWYNYMSSVINCLPVCLYICLFLFSLFSFVALRSLFDEIATCTTNKLLNLTELMELPLVEWISLFNSVKLNNSFVVELKSKTIQRVLHCFLYDSGSCSVLCQISYELILGCCHSL